MSTESQVTSTIRQIRIAFVIPSLTSAFRYWEPIVGALQARGAHVLVVTATPLSERTSIPLQIVRSIKVTSPETTTYSKSVRLTSPSLVRNLTSYRPNVIIAVEYGLASLWAIIAGKICRSRILLLQEHRTPASWRTFPRRIFRRALITLSDGLIANTKGAKQELLTSWGVKEDRIHEIPLVIPPPRKDLLRQPVTVPAAAVRPIFLFVGRLIPRKNVESLLRAAYLLAAKGCSFGIWIVGDGPLRRVLEQTSQSLGLTDRLNFLGAIPYPSIGFFYEACDVFVMPSHTDYRSVAVLEAMRFGKPILDSLSDGNAHDSVLDGVNGFLFLPNRPEDLARSMRRFIDQYSLVREMGERSSELVGGLRAEISADRILRLPKG